MSESALRPSLTVVVVSHNYGSFLDEALASVVAQSRPADEIVVVDDASSDETPEVAERWADKIDTLVSIRNPLRLGPAGSFNLGLQRARGELVVKLDGDDRFSDSYLARLTDALERSGADIAYSGVQHFGAETSRIPARPFDARELMRENFINGSALMRRAVWERTGGYREELDALGLEDWELFVHAVSLGMRAVSVDGCWLEYRRHAGGSRNTMSRFRALRAHLMVRRLHRDTVSLSDVSAWAARSVRRNLTGVAAQG